MGTVLALMNRNRKLFFKDKGMLFTSMITPVVLIVLYATFLAKVFRDSFIAAIPDMITISDKLITYGSELYHCNILCESDYGAGQGKWNKEGF